MEKEHWSNLSHLKKRVDLIQDKPGKIVTSDLELIYEFAGKLASKEMLGGFIQAVVLFGSVAQDEATEDSDLDVLVIIDDVGNRVTSEMANAYSLSVGSLLAKLKAHDKIHLTTIGMIRFWDGVRNGDPVIMSILRTGKPIVDTGFFNPLKAMMERGMIKSTPEAVKANLGLAESLLRNQPIYFQRSVADFYWAVIDSAHSLIMHAGLEPVSPRKSVKVFEQAAKKLGVDPKLSAMITEFLDLVKKRESFTGKQVDAYRKKAEKFVTSVKKAIKL